MTSSVDSLAIMSALDAPVAIPEPLTADESSELSKRQNDDIDEYLLPTLMACFGSSFPQTNDQFFKGGVCPSLVNDYSPTLAPASEFGVDDSDRGTEAAGEAPRFSNSLVVGELSPQFLLSDPTLVPFLPCSPNSTAPFNFSAPFESSEIDFSAAVGIPPLSASSSLSHRSALSLLDDEEEEEDCMLEQRGHVTLDSADANSREDFDERQQQGHQPRIDQRPQFDSSSTSTSSSSYLAGGDVLLADLVDELPLQARSLEKRRDSGASDETYPGSKGSKRMRTADFDDDLPDDASVQSRVRAGSSSLSVESASSARTAFPGRSVPLIGENRLKIKFQNLGHLGDVPQHFGKKHAMIPDGVMGTHEVYGQRWKWEIRHLRLCESANETTTAVQWTITNLSSGTKIARIETPHEAFLREFKGQTICNQLLRDALNIRAKELDRDLERFKDKPVKVANIKSCLKSLRPKKCIMGLLFFGLLHQCVQDNLKREEEQRHSSAVPG